MENLGFEMKETISLSSNTCASHPVEWEKSEDVLGQLSCVIDTYSEYILRRKFKKEKHLFLSSLIIGRYLP